MLKSLKNPDSQKLLFQKYSYNSSKAKHQNVIQGHYFNKQVSVMLKIINVSIYLEIC